MLYLPQRHRLKLAAPRKGPKNSADTGETK